MIQNMQALYLNEINISQVDSACNGNNNKCTIPECAGTVPGKDKAELNCFLSNLLCRKIFTTSSSSVFCKCGRNVYHVSSQKQRNLE